jgi:NADP-dependent 3-hydroxy acid dehydrogenase YdfG
VLINNAGIMKLAKVADSGDALFDQQIAINLKGSFNTMREAARTLRDGGRIANFSTSVVGTKLETYGVYTVTKAAIEATTGILSKRCAAVRSPSTPWHRDRRRPTCFSTENRPNWSNASSKWRRWNGSRRRKTSQAP